MGRTSTMRLLPRDIKERLIELFDQGVPLRDIIEALRPLGVNTSLGVLHRYKQEIDKATERIRRSRAVAEATVQALGKEPDSKVTRLNVDLLQGFIHELASATEISTDGTGAGTPMGAMLMAKAVEHLAKAKRHDAELIVKLKAEARKEAEAEMRDRVKALGSAEELQALTIEELEARIAKLSATN